MLMQCIPANATTKYAKLGAMNHAGSQKENNKMVHTYKPVQDTHTAAHFLALNFLDNPLKLLNFHTLTNAAPSIDLHTNILRLLLLCEVCQPGG